MEEGRGSDSLPHAPVSLPPTLGSQDSEFPLSVFSRVAPWRQVVGVLDRSLLRTRDRQGWQVVDVSISSLSPPPPSGLSPTSACFLSPKPTAQGTSSLLWGRAALWEQSDSTEEGGTVTVF